MPKLKHHKPPEEYIFWGPLSRLVQRYLNWFLIDMGTTWIALTLTAMLWRVFEPLNVGVFQTMLFVTIYAIIFSISGTVSGIQRIAWRYAPAEDALDLILPTLVAGFVTFTISYFFGIFPVGMIFCAAGLAFVGYALTRYRQRILTGFLTRWVAWRGTRQNLRERILIVGGGEAGQFAAWSLMNSANASAFQVVGFVDDDMFKQQVRLRGVHVIGKRSQIPALVKQYDAGMIVYAIHNIAEAEKQEILAICHQTKVRTIIWPDVLAFVRQSTATSESQEEPEEMTKQTGHSIRCEQIHSWLDGMEAHIKNGSISSLEEQIRSIRAQL